MEKSKIRQGLPYTAAGVAGLAFGLVGVGGVELFHNADRSAEVQAFAERMAASRNTCAIDSVTPTRAFGGPALKVTITLGSRMAPADVQGAYDGLGMHTAFADGTGNLESGVLVESVDAGDPSVGQLALGSMPGDGPDSHTNSMTFRVPENSDAIKGYQVFRQNTIDASVTGPLVADAYYHESAKVQCGSFEYHPGSAPRIDP